jgi:DNA replication protein DnaC
MTGEARFLPTEDLIAQLRKAASTWFKNSDLLLLEELIRRHLRNSDLLLLEELIRRQRQRDDADWHAHINEISDICNTTIIYDSMSKEQIIDLFHKTLARIDEMACYPPQKEKVDG